MARPKPNVPTRPEPDIAQHIKEVTVQVSAPPMPDMISAIQGTPRLHDPNFKGNLYHNAQITPSTTLGGFSSSGFVQHGSLLYFDPEAAAQGQATYIHEDDHFVLSDIEGFPLKAVQGWADDTAWAHYNREWEKLLDWWTQPNAFASDGWKRIRKWIAPYTLVRGTWDAMDDANRQLWQQRNDRNLNLWQKAPCMFANCYMAYGLSLGPYETLLREHLRLAVEAHKAGRSDGRPTPVYAGVQMRWTSGPDAWWLPAQERGNYQNLKPWLDVLDKCLAVDYEGHKIAGLWPWDGGRWYWNYSVDPTHGAYTKLNAPISSEAAFMGLPHDYPNSPAQGQWMEFLGLMIVNTCVNRLQIAGRRG